MEFGRSATIDGGIDFSLPEDYSSVAWSSVVGGQVPKPAAKPLSTWVGLPRFGSANVARKVYPRGTRSSDSLRAYAQRFSSLELNATHYRLPTLEQVARWAAAVGPGFRFVPKAPQVISHERCPDLGLWRAFAETTFGFEEKLGPCLLQLPEYADTSWRRSVFDLTRSYPGRLALELRHASWFRERTTFERLIRYLQERDIALVLTDTAARRDVLHMARTASFVWYDS
jgi:uncharacterized protein YecE (DUF72 family)